MQAPALCGVLLSICFVGYGLMVQLVQQLLVASPNVHLNLSRFAVASSYYFDLAEKQLAALDFVDYHTQRDYYCKQLVALHFLVGYKQQVAFVDLEPPFELVPFVFVVASIALEQCVANFDLEQDAQFDV